MRVVVDASVALKWFFRDREADVVQALDLLRGVAEARLALLQPPHFLAEVSAVLARESPATAAASLRDLITIQMEVEGGEALYRRAIALSARLGCHLFDTLYHALAFERSDAVLVTADERYYKKARGEGRVVRLAEFAA